METRTKLTEKNLCIEQGYYVELECCMCTNTQHFAAGTKEDLLKEIEDEGWKQLDSDDYRLVGDHCGCRY